jgi:hypothetical protein
MDFEKLNFDISKAFARYSSRTELAIASPVSVFRNGYIAALENQGAPAEQSGEAPRQQANGCHAEH